DRNVTGVQTCALPICDQFGHARADASPRLKPDFTKYVNRFGCGGELKEKRLEQNYRSRDATNPSNDGRCFAGLMHKVGDWLPISRQMCAFPYSCGGDR